MKCADRSQVACVSKMKCNLNYIIHVKFLIQHTPSTWSINTWYLTLQLLCLWLNADKILLFQKQFHFQGCIIKVKAIKFFHLINVLQIILFIRTRYLNLKYFNVISFYKNSVVNVYIVLQLHTIFIRLGRYANIRCKIFATLMVGTHK